MDQIKSFVAHSFTKEDQDVVAVILKYLTTVSQLNPRFSWVDAEHPEPEVVDEKVLALFADKNLFIAICTRKERVVDSGALSEKWYAPGRYVGGKGAFTWKTSDWIIQEIGVALGREMKIVLLIEENTRSPGSMQGNLEYITFSRNSPEKCFDKLLGMIASLSPKTPNAAIASQDVDLTTSTENEAAQASAASAWTTPAEGWRLKDYKFALMHFIATRNEAGERQIEESFLGSEDGGLPENRKLWAAYKEYVRIIFNDGGDLGRIERLVDEFPGSGELAAQLGQAYSYYEEHGKAGTHFARAAELVSNTEREIELLGEAASSFMKDGNETGARNLVDKMRIRSQEIGAGEDEVLSAEISLSKESKKHHVEIGAYERKLELKPGDDETRFSLAYQYSNLDQDNLAAFHYSRLQNKSAIAWNNLGVSLDQLGLPIKSVSAYRNSEKAGETLAMSNLAIKLLKGGFVTESRAILESALKVANHHKNIESTISALNSASDAEEAKESGVFKKAKVVSEFYRRFGQALSKTSTATIVGKWKGPSFDLLISVSQSKLSGIGRYKSESALMALALFSAGGGGGGAQSPTFFIVEYRGELIGRAIVGTVTRRREGEEQRKAASVLTDVDSSPDVLMWIDDSGNKIFVMERNGNTDQRFYEFDRIAP